MKKQKRKPEKWALAFLTLGLTFCLGSGPVVAAEPDPYAEVNESWDRFGDVYLHILENYYTHLDQSHVMRSAIEGMIKDLDPYSQYYDSEGLRQLRQDTTGKFAGLGITVGIKDRYPVVIVPLEDTPAARAGLLPGDQLVGIDGKNTLGSSLDEVVGMLRGEPASKVRLKIQRYGKPPWEQTLDREIIKIKSVALTEVLDQDVGYISMKQTRFSEDTGAEVAEALRNLKEKGVKGVILDLRGNPGGLLSQAVEVAELVLPKGAPIVTVKERDNKKEEKKSARGHSVSEALPLVVMIDGGSASAAEIVAGAIQDNDRGVILGTNSFGKGSVQTIFDLHESVASALKLTTALYYTPSGRCIHRESHSAAKKLLLKVPFGEVELPAAGVLEILLRSADPMQAEAELKSRFDLDESVTAQILAEPLGNLIGHTPKIHPDESADSLTNEQKQIYLTRKGRRVYGGGGIMPDVPSEPASPPTVVTELEKVRAFFDFAVEYVGKDSSRSNLDVAPEVTAEVLTAFESFVQSGRDSALRALAEGGIEKTKIAEMKKLGGERKWNERAMAALDTLEEVLQAEGDQGVVNPVTEPFIKAAIERELVLRVQGKRASILTELKGDVQAKAAIELLKTPQRYGQLLVATGP